MVFTQPMNWETARKNCESNGAKLASLRNEWSQAYAELLTFNAKASLWIGMNKNEVQGRKPLKLKTLTLETVFCNCWIVDLVIFFNINYKYSIYITDNFYEAKCFLCFCPVQS